MIRGVKAVIRWAYYNAAAINGYTVTRKDGTWNLRATVVSSDAFKMAQRPLVFVAPHAKGEWRWPIESLRVEANQLVATLGTPDKETSGHGLIVVR